MIHLVSLFLKQSAAFGQLPSAGLPSFLLHKLLEEPPACVVHQKVTMEKMVKG